MTPHDRLAQMVAILNAMRDPAALAVGLVGEPEPKEVPTIGLATKLRFLEQAVGAAYLAAADELAYLDRLELVAAGDARRSPG